jgi:hypothetical protein
VVLTDRAGSLEGRLPTSVPGDPHKAVAVSQISKIAGSSSGSSRGSTGWRGPAAPRLAAEILQRQGVTITNVRDAM